MEKLIVFLIIIGFSIIKSLIDKAAERRAQLPREIQVRPPANHREKVQSEIEAFLSEVRSATEGNQPAGREQRGERPVAAQASPAVRPAPRADVSQRSDRPSARQQGSPARQQSQSGQQRKRARNQQQERMEKKTASTPSRRTSNSATRTSTAHSRSDQQIIENVEPHLHRSLDHRSRTESANRSGMSSRESVGDERSQTTERAGSLAASLRESLRSPSGMRQAILMSEVLRRPKVFQQRD